MPGMLGYLSSPFFTFLHLSSPFFTFLHLSSPTDKTSQLFENWLPSFSLPVCYCAKVAGTCKNILVFGWLDKFSSYLGWACGDPAFSNLKFGFVA
jgi:hypothetical protein